MDTMNTMVSAVRASPHLRLAGVIVGLLLLIAAVVVVTRQRDMVFAALSSVQRADLWRLALLGAIITVHLSTSATMFFVLTQKYGRVPWFDMQMLIAGAALLNYLPLRPGLIGRIAYQKAAYNIAARDSIRIIVESLLLSAATGVWVLLCAAATLVVPVSFTLLCALMPALLLIGCATPARRWCLAGLLRTLEIALWALRYFLAFGLLGVDLTVEAAMIIGCMSLFANLVPFFSNGLGLREWGVGLLAPRLAHGQPAVTLELSMAAELLNRAMEIIVVLLFGGIALLWLMSRRRALSARHEAPPPASDDTSSRRNA
jgi:hypothetical protein